MIDFKVTRHDAPMWIQKNNGASNPSARSIRRAAKRIARKAKKAKA